MPIDWQAESLGDVLRILSRLRCSDLCSVACSLEDDRDGGGSQTSVVEALKSKVKSAS